LNPGESLANRGTTGEWSGVFGLNSRAVHMTLLKGTGGNHSQVVWWPEDNSETTAAHV
jgi:hypothetical protein